MSDTLQLASIAPGQLVSFPHKKAACNANRRLFHKLVEDFTLLTQRRKGAETQIFSLRLCSFAPLR